MKKVREMPAEGYYVYTDPYPDTDCEVVYTTGIAGKGGHMYYRILNGDVWGWATLLWTCVPSVKDAKRLYTYYKECPSFIPQKPDTIKRKI